MRRAFREDAARWVIPGQITPQSELSSESYSFAAVHSYVFKGDAISGGLLRGADRKGYLLFMAFYSGPSWSFLD